MGQPQRIDGEEAAEIATIREALNAQMDARPWSLYMTLNDSSLLDDGIAVLSEYERGR